MEIKNYQRKPIIVQAVRVTEENFFDVAHWCQGAIVTPGGVNKSISEISATKDKHIKVRVINPQRPRQTKAFVGDWVLYSEYNGYKVYTNGAFENAFFGPVDTRSVEDARNELEAEFKAAHPELVPDGTYGGAREVS